MGFLIPCLVFLLVQFLCQFTFGLFISNFYLVELISIIISSFVFAIMATPFDRKHFYKNFFFHKAFTSTVTGFLLISMIFHMLGI